MFPRTISDTTPSALSDVWGLHSQGLAAAQGYETGRVVGERLVQEERRAAASFPGSLLG